MKKKNSKKELLERYGGKALQVVQITHVAARVAKDEAARERMQGNKPRAEILEGIANDCNRIGKRLSSYSPTMIAQRLQFAERYIGDPLIKEWQRVCPTALNELRVKPELWEI